MWVGPRIIVVPAATLAWCGFIAWKLGHGNSGQIAAMVIGGIIGLIAVISYSVWAAKEDRRKREEEWRNRMGP